MAATDGEDRELSAAARSSDRPGTDWPAQATDTIVDLVDQVREKTTGQMVTVARGVVFGVLIGVVVVLGITSFVVGLVRLAQIGIEAVASAAGTEVSQATSVWLSYLIVGCLFSVAGAMLWRLANRKAVEPIGQVQSGTA